MLKIYLGDLIYDSFSTNYVVPLNIAFIAAYVKEKYTSDVDIVILEENEIKEPYHCINNHIGVPFCDLQILDYIYLFTYKRSLD